jgi:hypothetical protein
MTTYQTRITRVHVGPAGEPMHSECVTAIEIDDEGCGEFVKVSQQGGNINYEKFVLIDANEWPQLRWAIDKMIKECKP